MSKFSSYLTVVDVVYWLVEERNTVVVIKVEGFNQYSGDSEENWAELL